MLLDDRAGRPAAAQCALAVVGTLGLLEQASVRGRIAPPEALERLRKTNARLDSKLIEAVRERYRLRSAPSG
jgi:predicted nucleic acid-binding protein